MLLIFNFQNMRLHSLAEISSIRLQQSAGMNPEGNGKERMTEGILHHRYGQEEQKLWITGLRGNTEQRTR